MPLSVAESLRNRRQRHQAWTAFEAGISDLEDEQVIIYSEEHGAVLVTTNRNCATQAQQMECSSTVWLCVRETDAVAAMALALEWLSANTLPQGRVLKVHKTVPPVLLNPPRARRRRPN